MREKPYGKPTTKLIGWDLTSRMQFELACDEHANDENPKPYWE